MITMNNGMSVRQLAVVVGFLLCSVSSIASAANTCPNLTGDWTCTRNIPGGHQVQQISISQSDTAGITSYNHNNITAGKVNVFVADDTWHPFGATYNLKLSCKDDVAHFIFAADPLDLSTNSSEAYEFVFIDPVTSLPTMMIEHSIMRDDTGDQIDFVYSCVPGI